MLSPASLVAPLSKAVVRFANLESIESTAQVEGIFVDALKQAGRPVVFPDGTTVPMRFQTIEPEKVAAYRTNQITTNQLLRHLAELTPPKKGKGRNDKAQLLRAKISPTLQRLVFTTTFDFDGGGLRLYPLVLGVETSIYLIIAEALEAGTQVHVKQCKDEDCEKFVIHPPGQRGDKSRYCAFHRAQHSKGKIK